MQNHLEIRGNHTLVENILLEMGTNHKRLKVRMTLLNNYIYKDLLDNHLYNYYPHLLLK